MPRADENQSATQPSDESDNSPKIRDFSPLTPAEKERVLTGVKKLQDQGVLEHMAEDTASEAESEEK